MKTRKLGEFEVSEISLGCMNMSHAYGAPDMDEAERLLNNCLDMGYSMLDTAALYGFGKNEELIGRIMKSRRNDYILASKCGMFKNDEGVRTIDGRPEILRKTCEDALQRLQTDVIDLYYLHRIDRKVPVEESVGTLADLVSEGKIRSIGLSEASSESIKKAHAIHPIAAVQSEYSLWARNPEIAVLDTCKELGISFVAFSPLARAFLTNTLHDVEQQLEKGDIRRNMPRFQADHWQVNLNLLPAYVAIAERNDCTPAQLALAWLLAKGDHIIPIPGTKHYDFAVENAAASDVTLSSDVIDELDQLINQHTVSGPRYNASTQAEIDTEEFA